MTGWEQPRYSKFQFRTVTTLSSLLSPLLSSLSQSAVHDANMNYPIPATTQEIVALRQKPVTEELIASAIAGVVHHARSQGQSLEELMAEVLADDTVLDAQQRRWLSEIVAQAWKTLP